MADHRIIFTPSGLSGTVADGTSVLAAARQLGVDLDSVCGGRGVCGRCTVRPGHGSFPKWALTVGPDHLSALGPVEETYRSWRPLAEGLRLGCTARVVGDVVIDVPATSQLHRQVVRKDVALGPLTLDPLVTLHYLELPALDAEDGTSVAQQVAAELERSWGITRAALDAHLLPRLHPAAAGRALTVALRDGRVVALWPGLVDRVVGVAVDVGSTTVAGHLCDLHSGEILASAGRMNPQIRFGEDLMSRVSYVMLNQGGAAALTGAIREALAELVAELLAQAGPIDRSQLLELVVVGNPIMHHLLLGIDPTPLGQAPFILATTAPVEAPAGLIGLDAPSARLYAAPLIAGHVGADTAAAILAEGPHRGDAIQLLVDVGTNAEIVVGNRHGLLAASSPTGPAFEGAQISAGQRATAGAVERVRVDPTTLEPRFKVIGVEPWSDEPGFAQATARTGVTGICGSGIIEVMAELFTAGVIDGNGVIRPEAAARSPRVVADQRTFSYTLADGILVTQADVRAIQLAKAALRAGIELLLEKAGIDRVDEVRLAGAFGAHISPVHAMTLGLIPPCPVDRVHSVGNAAGGGALRALLSRAERTEMEQVVAAVTKIETATEARFQDHFVAALAIPHGSAQAAGGTRPRRPRRRAAAQT